MAAHTDDDELDAVHIKENLKDYLEVISNGSFATSGTLSNAANPGIFFEVLGKIGLPLSEIDASEICRINHEFPLGKGTKTFVDTTVRKTWELNPSQFQLRNPSWQSTLQDAVGKVAKELGVLEGAESIQAELHKLLLYEPGAFFDNIESKCTLSQCPSHILTEYSTEKAPGMFAALVIALPSEHIGGDVIAQLEDLEQALKTSVQSEFSYSYLGWYADVSHLAKPVESGCRLVLTYNLMHTATSSSRKVSDLEDHKLNLDKILRFWAGQLDNEDYGTHVSLLYILEHEYSEANSCLDYLKGKDKL